MQTRTLGTRSRARKFDPATSRLPVSPLALAWLLTFLALAGFCFYKGKTAPDFTSKPIGEVQLGERTTGKNPLLTDLERANIPDIDPATWRKLELEMVKSNGKMLWIKLLWPLKDIKAAGAEVGETIDLFMWEMGAVGPARVVSIGPCPPIQSGKGNVVTGIFIHEPDDDMINMHVEGLDEPIGCTANHPFWSEDRQEFVAAGELKPGEQLRTRHVGTVSIASITPRPKDQLVYNLQVHGEHVYEVSKLAALVHNTCGVAPGENVTILGRYMSRVQKAKDVFESAGAKVNTYKWRKYNGVGKLTADQLTDAQRLNREWLARRIHKGDRIFDIGLPEGKADLGDFYSEELVYLGKRMVPKPRGKLDIGGEIVDVWEWVLK